jgi:hypothetical protein
MLRQTYIIKIYRFESIVAVLNLVTLSLIALSYEIRDLSCKILYNIQYHTCTGW